MTYILRQIELDDKMCQQVAQMSNEMSDQGDLRGADGDIAGQAVGYKLSEILSSQVQDNCLVVD